MLMIGTPCYDGTVTLQYMLAMMGLKDVLNKERIAFKLVTPAHESLISRARNSIANEFLRLESCSHLLFIDADIEFSPAIVPYLLAAGKDVVCGVYPVKGLRLDRLMAQPEGTPPAVAEAACLDYAVKVKPGCLVDADGFVEVEYAATGFMLIRRQVLIRLAEACPELRYRYAYINEAVQDNYAFFDTAIDPETRDYLPEDYAFCKRWRDIGGAVHACVLGRFAHVGSRTYAGEFATYLARRGGRRGGGQGGRD